MQTVWLHRNNHRECILLFSGWGMDPAPFRFLPAANHDLCLFSDYRQLHPLSLDTFAGYERLHLSPGRWASGWPDISWPIRRHAFASCTAIGGTLAPIDKQRGIPPDSYAAMLDHFSQEVLDTFYRNMFDDEDQLTRFLANQAASGICTTCGMK